VICGHRHGFTTRDKGHGFGLHSAANAAKELGGALTLKSEGLQKGATFALRIPMKPPDQNEENKEETTGL